MRNKLQQNNCGHSVETVLALLHIDSAVTAASCGSWKVQYERVDAWWEACYQIGTNPRSVNGIILCVKATGHDMLRRLHNNICLLARASVPSSTSSHCLFSQMLCSNAQTRGRSHVRVPAVCNDGLKLAQKDLATPTPALVQTESYGHSIAALPKPLLEASLVGLKPYCNRRLRCLPNLATHHASKHM